MIKLLILALIMSLPSSVVSQIDNRTPKINTNSPITAYINGQWYQSKNGVTEFVKTDKYSIISQLCNYM